MAPKLAFPDSCPPVQYSVVNTRKSSHKLYSHACHRETLEEMYVQVVAYGVRVIPLLERIIFWAVWNESLWLIRGLDVRST
jgi:hypothetical protein